MISIGASFLAEGFLIGICLLFLSQIQIRKLINVNDECRVDVQCQWPKLRVNVYGQCRRLMLMANVDGQSRRSMSMMNVDGQCRIVNGQC